MKNSFDFLTDYKYYGRRRLNEDELDDMLNLTPDAQPQDNVAPSGDAPEQAQMPAQDGATIPQMGTEQPMDAPAENADEQQPPSTNDNAVELDVTQLVLKQDEINKNVQATLDQISQLMKTNQELKASVDSQLKGFEEKNEKTIDSLKQEFEKRNPTPIEQLSLRSLSSFPYNIKLTDYWKPTEEDKYKYQIANAKVDVNSDPKFTVNTENLPNVNPPEQEYVLKQSDVMRGYDENFVKNSF